MKLWRYKAIPGTTSRTRSASQEPGSYIAGVKVGELAGHSPADVRAALRRIGLQVIELNPVRSADQSWYRRTAMAQVLNHGMRTWQIYLRRRRIAKRAEFYDSLATMTSSGLPLLEALDTMIAAAGSRRGQFHTMLIHIREQLRAGRSLADAMQAHASWFDSAEIAMIDAGQHGGNLSAVLGRLADRHERSGELSSKLVGALAYPAIVTFVGIGVVMFLSVKTLPDLTAILTSAKVEPPPLTVAVMSVGQFVTRYWWLVAMVGVVISLTAIASAKAWIARSAAARHVFMRCYPKVLRRLAVARMAQQLAELKQCGVPIVESLRILASGNTGISGSLNAVIRQAADRVERGDELSQALDDDLWFDAEFRRLLEVGQASGEIDQLLFKVAERYTRQSRRLIDRLAAMLEPVVLLVLACLVGVVVMAAILPLLRLREIL